MADDALNKTGIFSKQAGLEKTPIRNDNFGATFGGPVVLPGYNGRNKTFFFTNFDYTRIRSGTLSGFGNTTPIDAFKNGDFSRLLTGTQVATDALGRPIFQGQIFNPATTRLVNGIPVRDPYPNNFIPAGDPLRSQVAARIAPLMVSPDRDTHLEQRGGQSSRRSDVGDRRAQHHVQRSTTTSLRTSDPASASTGTGGRRCETAARSPGAPSRTIPKRSRR